MNGNRQRIRSMSMLVLILTLILPAQSVANAQAADQVLINEIMQNPSAVPDSSGEWFELYNFGDTAVDIDGWTVQDNDFDSHVINNGGPLLIPAGGYLVLGNNANSATNGGLSVDYVYGANMFLSNSADEVVLLDGSSNEIDRVEYDGGPVFPDPNGASMALQDPALDNNIGANWCTAITPFGAGDLGTPGAANDCLSPLPELVINEIMQNPSAVSDSAGEWFELYNPGAVDVDINGWTLQDNDYDSLVIDNGDPLLVPAGGYLVLGNNADSSTNGGVAVAYQYAGMYLSNSADELVLIDAAASEIDRVEYDGGPVFPDPNGASMTLQDPTLDNNDGANWCTAITPFGAGDLGTPGAENQCPSPSCGAPATLIHSIQGPGNVSPLDGSVVEVEAVVTADFQAYGGLGGFFLQEEGTDVDSDPLTSEGIFVFNYSYDVNVGDVVRVTGEVDEYFGLTELKNVSDVQICSSGVSVTPATVSLPVADLADWEAYEGMLVHIPQTLYATDNYNLGRYGEVTLSVDDRQYVPTNVVAPGDPALTLQGLNDRSRIQLDDGSTFQNPQPLPPYLGTDNTLRAGDTINDLTGALGYAFGVYEIHPIGPVSFARVNERAPAPGDGGGSVQVASFNVLNYFTTIDDSGPICGPSGDMGCRGADTPEEFARQRAKIISALSAMNADVVGLIEIENNATTAVEDLVNGLNDAVGPGTYGYVDTGTIGTDAIKVALIYKPASVTPVGAYAILDETVDGRFIDTKNRPALAQTFEENATGARFTAVVNHLKSKGSPCDDIGDPDLGDGQGNCNVTRTLAAQALADWLQTDPTGSIDPDVLIVGDLNAYAMEDPITTLEAAGYTDQLERFVGGNAYSYVFFGQAGYLDHALANTSLVVQVTGLTPWHINADEPSALNYNDYNQDALYNPDPFRASDHDPLIVGLDLNRPPDCSTAAPSIDTLWPVNHKFVTVEVIGVTDPEGDPVTISIDSIYQDEPVNDTDDGNTAPDGIIDGSQAQVRAERDGEGNGRVYYISFTARDDFGSCTETVQVSVPISVKATAIGDGTLYDSTVY